MVGRALSVRGPTKSLAMALAWRAMRLKALGLMAGSPGTTSGSTSNVRRSPVSPAASATMPWKASSWLGIATSG